ncbi:hypothetical protein PS619_00516 [Pseudomonas fluorescens]|nr:hypothetical protein PS619_00516 [Pseudomonas fluorescens]
MTMRSPWENRIKPQITHIMSLFENETLGAYLAGHLILESILVIMLETKPSDSDQGAYFDWSFHRKITASESRGLITRKMAEFLLEANRLRNRLAHKLDSPISFEEAFHLAQKASNGGVNFSDDTIHSDRAKSEEWYSVNGVIQEIFQNASQDLLYLLDDDDHITSFVSDDES